MTTQTLLKHLEDATPTQRVIITHEGDEWRINEIDLTQIDGVHLHISTYTPNPLDANAIVNHMQANSLAEALVDANPESTVYLIDEYETKHQISSVDTHELYEHIRVELG